MRLVLAALFALAAAGGAAAEPAANAGPAVQAGVTDNRAPTGQPPFGGTFESRLQRLGADVDDGVRRGWLSRAQGQDFTRRIGALGDEVKAVRDRNGGKLPKADNHRLQDRVTALHKQLADLAAAGSKAKG
jgi:hypothetical protein